MSTRELTEADRAFPIRRGMDVYSADQSDYVGSVVGVVYDGRKRTPGAGPAETGSSGEAVGGNPGLVHEQGATVSPTDQMRKRRLGEEMGPVPTIGLGNSGPVKQSAGEHYATRPIHPERGVICFAVRPGRINLGFLTRFLWIPTGAIRSISMERIVLNVRKDEMPLEWRKKP